MEEYFSGKHIKSIPDLNNSTIDRLHIYNTSIRVLPKLPATLHELTLTANSDLDPALVFKKIEFDTHGGRMSDFVQDVNAYIDKRRKLVSSMQALSTTKKVGKDLFKQLPGDISTHIVGMLTHTPPKKHLFEKLHQEFLNLTDRRDTMPVTAGVPERDGDVLFFGNRRTLKAEPPKLYRRKSESVPTYKYADRRLSHGGRSKKVMRRR
jgi:hypothetical protein